MEKHPGERACVRKENTQSIPVKKGTGTIPVLCVEEERCLAREEESREMQGTRNRDKRTFSEIGLCLPIAIQHVLASFLSP